LLPITEPGHHKKPGLSMRADWDEVLGWAFADEGVRKLRLAREARL